MSSEELERVNLSELDRLGIEVHDTKLVIPPGTNPRVVVRVAKGILAFGKRWPWYFLDCYLFIRDTEGQESASQFLDEQGYSNGYLHNIVSWGHRVELDARVIDLPFSHYEAIAQLPKKEQRAWVEKARPDPDEDVHKPMPRDELREKVATHLNEVHAGVNGSTIDNEEGSAQIIYRECTRCKNCEECQGTQSVRVN